MEKICFAFIALLILATAACQSPKKDTEAQKSDPLCSAPVKTESGLVKGLAESETQTCVWRGIPYAAPPVGDLRWKAPQPALQWEGVRDGSVWGARCMGMFGMAQKYFDRDPSGKMSEDCLFLNVWRPKKEGKFPVMVWVHGGGYASGTANTPLYWGDRLAQAGDVVVVSINYRLNYFGFLALPALRDEDPNKSTGSYGSLDQAAALKWVRDNISAFGGDPQNVTVFGESAGGMSVCTLLASPLASGLFHKAIIESGPCKVGATLERGYEQGKRAASAWDCGPDDLECLRAVPAKKIIAARHGRMRIFMPHQDGYFLDASALETLRSGKFNKVPVMAGFNRDEFSVIARAFNPRLRKAGPEAYPKKIAALLSLNKKDAEELVKLYPISEFDNKVINAYGRMKSDTGIICGTFQGLEAAASHQADAYLYRFDFDGFRLGQRIGAMHAMELPFVFDAFGRSFNRLYKEDNLKKARPLSKIMMAYWTNFAKTGDPNGPGLPEWPKFDPNDQKLLVLDEEISVAPVGLSDRCKFWEEHRTRLDW